MTDPIQLSDTSARFGLPFLRAGQAQKEFFVNQAIGLSDFLHHTSALGEAVEPPVDPADGDLWLVGPDAGGEWSGRTGQLAGRQAGTWLYLAPVEGMRLFDRATGQSLLYAGGWQRPPVPAPVTGGAVIDAELRAAFVQLLEALGAAGIFPVTQ